LDEGSLTQRLIKTSGGQFSVQLLSQQWQQPAQHERTLLGMAARELGIVREVLLCCHGQPWVFARSVMPARSLAGHLRRFRHLDNSSLGAILFSDPSMRRRPFEITQLHGRDPQLPSCVHSDSTLWGRRCRFELGGKPVMVSEIFLPGFRA
jgi:chorismate--pyruvate lyase